MYFYAHDCISMMANRDYGDLLYNQMATFIETCKIAIAFFCYNRKRGFRSYAEVAPSLPYF